MDPLDISSGAGGGALGSLITAGMGAMSGNPIAIASGAIGLGMTLFGGSQQVSAAKQTAEAQRQIAADEIKQDSVRRKAMELAASRQQMEVFRNAQRARALALNNATSQGAQFGSGLQGGYGQVGGQANWQSSGIQRNLGFGEQMFDINNEINQQKMIIAAAGGTSATGAGISKLGSTLMSSFGPIKNISGTIGGTNAFSSNGTGGYSQGNLGGTGGLY